jgi:hypothetical protein
MEKKLSSASEWLKLKRNEGCPQHGFHLADSLVKYSGYCSKCDQFWMFRRRIEKKDIPYWWSYFNPETHQLIGKTFTGRKNSGKSSRRETKT